MCGQRTTSTADHLVQGWNRTVQPQLLQGSRVENGKPQVQVQDGDRPGDSDGRRILRVSGRQLPFGRHPGVSHRVHSIVVHGSSPTRLEEIKQEKCGTRKYCKGKEQGRHSRAGICRQKKSSQQIRHPRYHPNRSETSKIPSQQIRDIHETISTDQTSKKPSPQIRDIQETISTDQTSKKPSQQIRYIQETISTDQRHPRYHPNRSETSKKHGRQGYGPEVPKLV